MKGLNKYILIGAVVLLIVVVILIYMFGRSAGKNKVRTTPPSQLPNSGSGIPQGWTPGQAAINLEASMSTWEGTDEDLFFNTLEPLTLDQRVAVVNEFNRRFQVSSGADFVEWVLGDFEGAELARVTALFQGANLF